MKISKKDIEKLIKEEIEKLAVENVIKEGFSAYDAAAAPEVKEKLAEYGLDVGSYSDKEIGNLLQSFIYSFGTRIVSVEDTIRMIDSRYGPDGEYRFNKPEGQVISASEEAIEITNVYHLFRNWEKSFNYTRSP